LKTFIPGLSALSATDSHIDDHDLADKLVEARLYQQRDIEHHHRMARYPIPEHLADHRTADEWVDERVEPFPLIRIVEDDSAYCGPIQCAIRAQHRVWTKVLYDLSEAGRPRLDYLAGEEVRVNNGYALFGQKSRYGRFACGQQTPYTYSPDAIPPVRPTTEDQLGPAVYIPTEHIV
jgi:hypothetical protein